MRSEAVSVMPPLFLIMATIKAVLNRVKALDVQAVAVDSLRETSDAITEAVQRQALAGLRSDGSRILPEYSDLTISIKKEKGQPTDRVTLYDTGDYFRSMRTDVSANAVITTASDEKAENLRKKYGTRGGKLLTPGGKFKQGYIDDTLNPVFMRKIKKAIGFK